MKRRIAIYGGTFDPVHAGHLEIARQVTELFAIDEFLFLPALVAPHKQKSEVSSSLHRHAMLVLATKHDARLCISTLELESPGGQYTVDSLTQFRLRFGAGADLFFVLGADSWAEITTWREWERLLTLAHFVVVTRPGYEVLPAPFGGELSVDMVDVRGWSGPLASLSPAGAPPQIFVTDVVMTDVSATAVRQAARAERNGDLDQLVPPEVGHYIRKYRVYRNSHEN